MGCGCSVLRGGKYNGSMSWDDILRLAKSASKSDKYGLKAEFIELAKTAKNLSATKP